jgi:hypothetical protein
MIIENNCLIEVEDNDIEDGILIIPEEITKIEDSAFGYCKNLKKIKVSPNNPKYDSRENCNAIIEKSSNTLIFGCSNTIIPKGVTAIAYGAFEESAGLTKITIPKSVTSIGEFAFSGCKDLKEITIPEGVESIGESTFSGCTSLTKITIPESVTSIEDSAFFGCTGLKEITIPERVTSIGELTFSGCKALKEITIPKGVESIGDSAFSSCTSLKEITIPEGVTNIAYFVFEGCTGLTGIKVSPNNSRYDSRENCNAIIKKSSNTLIAGCKNTKIPEDVTNIAYGAFGDCTGLRDITIPKSVTSIEEYAFHNCTGLTKLTIPESVTKIEESAFSGCTSLTEIKVNANNGRYDSRENCNAIIDKSSNILILGCNNTVIPDGVTSIDRSAFSGCKGLTKITIPEGVTSIVGSSFSNCTGLEEITIPDSVTSIVGNAFSGCTGLAEITIPNSVTSILGNVFLGCTGLEEIAIPDSVINIECRAFSGCTGLTKIKVSPNNVRYDSRENCNAIIEKSSNILIVGCKNTKIPEGVASIGEFTFEDCIDLTEITIPESVTNIGDCAFKGCAGLTQITIPESVTNIGNCAFKGCTGLKEITIPKSVTRIEDLAFDGCKSLEKIIIPEGITASLIYISHDEELQSKLNKKSKEDLNTYFKIYDKFKENMNNDENFERSTFDKLLLKGIDAIGLDEFVKLADIPKNISKEDIERYSLENNEVLSKFYEDEYEIKGDLGVVFEIFKGINFGKLNDENTSIKNTPEMKIFRELNKLLEEENDLTLEKAFSKSIRNAGIEVNNSIEEKLISKIREIEKNIRKNNVKEIDNDILVKLNETGIVEEQIEPIKIMIESELKNSTGLNNEEIKENIRVRLAQANASYINQKADLIANSIGELISSEEIGKKFNKNALNSMKEVKEDIGVAWKYKLNKALESIGYTFQNIPESFNKEEKEKLEEILGNIVETEQTKKLKYSSQIEKVYEELKNVGYNKIVTFQQIHDMLEGINASTCEEFKNWYKSHKEELLYNPRAIEGFARIANAFEEIINSNELRNVYAKGKLDVDVCLGYLKTKIFANERKEDKELARYAAMYGSAKDEKEFEKVQEVWDITRKRERSSIPPVKIEDKKYRGRMLSPNDVLNLFAGDITTCCQHFKGIGEGAMFLGAIEENAGIFVIEEKGEDGKYRIIGQSLTIRQKGENGNNDRLVFDNIEITNSVREQLTDKEYEEILKIYEEAGKQAIEKDEKFLSKQLKDEKITLEQYQALRLKEVTAGLGYNNLRGLNQKSEAKNIVPSEAYYNYFGNKTPWIDSAIGVPEGSQSHSVVLATLSNKEKEELKVDKKVKLSEVPLWYGAEKEPTKYKEFEITEEVINKVKEIEKKAYRIDQQLMNKSNVKSANDLTTEYELKNSNIEIGSNEDWYMIYGKDSNGNICISDVAVLGTLNSESRMSKNLKLAIAESAYAVLKLMKETQDKGNELVCNATKDTSLINIKRMMEKKIVTIKDQHGKDIALDKFKQLVYENGEKVQTRNFDDESDIQMLDIKIIPDKEKLEEEIKKAEEFLTKLREKAIINGQEKEEGLDDARIKIRKNLDER